MAARMQLADFVKKRNGVALGAKYSLRNMLKRSLGAGSFPLFWHYWNPIWGYYLSRYVMRPVRAVAPDWLAVLATFLVSGALHDVAVSVVKWHMLVFFTPWFTLMGLLVVCSKQFAWSFRHLNWTLRALINFSLIAGTGLMTQGFLG